MHRAHSDIHAPGALADDCLGCAAAADAPFAHLDERKLAELVDKAVERAHGRRGIGDEPTETEAVAVASVLTTLERAGRLAEVNPRALEAYLRERWQIRCRIEGRA